MHCKIVCKKKIINQNNMIKIIIILLLYNGHVDRLDEYRIARRVLMTETSGGRVYEGD